MGYSKGFGGKLVEMQVICRTNIKTAPGDIYGISPGATLAHVVIQDLDWRYQGSLWDPARSHCPWLWE